MNFVRRQRVRLRKASEPEKMDARLRRVLRVKIFKGRKKEEEEEEKKKRKRAINQYLKTMIDWNPMN